MDSPVNQPYRTAIVFVAGFTQRRDEGNGIHAAFDRVYRRQAGPDSLVLYFPWIVDPSEVANYLASLAKETMTRTGHRLGLIIVGYSFGGYTATEICSCLQKTTDVVDDLILCDPVARWFGRFGWTRAAMPGRITVSPNVRRVRWFAQNHRRFRLLPRSFSQQSPRRDGPETLLTGPQMIDAEHTDIDGDPTFQRAVDWHCGNLKMGFRS